MSKAMKHLIFSVRPSAVATPCNRHYSYQVQQIRNRGSIQKWNILRTY